MGLPKEERLSIAPILGVEMQDIEGALPLDVATAGS